jgi:lysophospholipase L1-like esterase
MFVPIQFLQSKLGSQSMFFVPYLPLQFGGIMCRRRYFMAFITMVSAILTTSVGAKSSPHQKPGIPQVNARLLAGKKPVRIVCFGDSVTGLYYHTGGRRSYTDLLKIALRRLCRSADITTINAGISGHTTRDALKRIDTDVLAKKPSLVTVMFGLNDMTRIPLDEYRANLSTIVEKVRAGGAEVMLCTPNSVITTTSRPSAKLVQYCEVVRKVAREKNVALCDCYQAYEAVRIQDALAWRLLMSDEIHPNCDGHKLIAEQIAHTITGRQVSLSDIGPLQPAIPHTLAKLRANQPVKVLAMPPFAAAVAEAFQRIAPKVTVEVVPWAVETKSPTQTRVGGIQQPGITAQPDSLGTSIKTLTLLEKNAKETVRQLKPDLVVLAVPRTARFESRAEFIRAYTWIMNWSLSFGRQEWDCIVVHPDVTDPQNEAATNKTRHAYDDLIRQLVVAQDLTLIDRPKASTASAASLFADWIEQQWQ